MVNTIYLDNNATTKTDEKVFEVMKPYFCENYANPSSIHAFGGSLMTPIKTAREQVKELVGAKDSKEIIFTAGGTESANIAIWGVVNADKNKKHIITTRVEHACVLNLYKRLEQQGYTVTYLDIDTNGELDFEQLKDAVNPETVLVSCMWANNETGKVFPVAKVAEIVKKINPKTKVFVDAVQAAGKVDINVKDTQIDLLGIAGHKFHAPKGIGALYIKSGIMLSPVILGGHQERGKRPGTENVPAIIGLGYAAQLAKEGLAYEATEVKRLRDKLENGILERVYNARLNSSIVDRVPNTTNIGFEYVEGELILLHLSDLGICASSGSACTSGSLEPSHVLRAMKVPFTSLHGSIRFSLSRFTTEDEIDYALEKVPQVIEKVSSISPYQKELMELKKAKGFKI